MTYLTTLHINGQRALVYQDEAAQPPHRCEGLSQGIVFDADFSVDVASPLHQLSATTQQYTSSLPVFYTQQTDQSHFLTLQQHKNSQLMGWLIGCPSMDDAQVELEDMTHFINGEVLRFDIPAIGAQGSNIFGMDMDVVAELAAVAIASVHHGDAGR